LAEKEVKVRGNQKTAQRAWRKMGRQIRGYLKPNTLKRSRLGHIEVPNSDKKTWTKIEDEGGGGKPSDCKKLRTI
jgi:hypothetical protein